MKVLLIDADSTIPNLALMKLSAHHKSVGDSVELIRLNMPYYPNKKKADHSIDTNGYDKVYCSVIFEGNKCHISGNNIIYGGTGCDNLSIKLPKYVERLQPDYSIYPECDYSIGFITRGCIRNCYFCKVPKKEGYLHQVNTVEGVATRKKVRFLDNNILAFKDHCGIFKRCIELDIKACFNEGLDIRLITSENSLLLHQMNYVSEYIFAFDSIKNMELIENKLKLLQWRKDWQLKFYVYVHPDMPLSDTIERIRFLRERKLLPYIMRDISCWDAEYKNFYTDVASWCNQPGLFKKMTFEEFMIKRTKNENRINNTLKLWRQ